jgi:hypothetical protein
LVIIGWAGVFFGRLIQAAVSRQREYLADASAVQFTRNPDGLASALKKIGGLAYGSKLKAAQAQEASHMFFGNGLGASFLHLWDTHPPLVKRILAIDPSFDGTFPKLRFTEQPETSSPDATPSRHAPVRFPVPGASMAAPLAETETPPAIVTARILQGAGTVTPANLRYAEALRNAIPEELLQAVREPLGACTVVYGLLLSSDPAIQAAQLEQLEQATSPEMRQETVRILPALREAATRAKLPLVDLSIEGLRALSPFQFKQFRDALQLLVEADNEIDLFEYVLQKIVIRHLEPHFAPVRKPVIQYYSLKPLAADCGVLLSGLARVGNEESANVEVAFRQGATILAGLAQEGVPFASEQECGLAQIDEALNRLSQATPVIRKRTIEACAFTVSADGVIREAEAELLRGIADALGCPIPPFANPEAR